jgi:hypothetical protein
MFAEVKANEIQFDDQGIIKSIRGSRFASEGKATYVKRIINDLNCAPMEVLFVGNSLNDNWASQSGARTLCVNPADVDFTNTLVWTEFIKEMGMLRALDAMSRAGVRSTIAAVELLAHRYRAVLTCAAIPDDRPAHPFNFKSANLRDLFELGRTEAMSGQAFRRTARGPWREVDRLAGAQAA